MCKFHSIYSFIHYCHVIIVYNDYLVHFCYGFVFGFWVVTN